jgi:DNA-directed RNA polymerase specialized sigma24 family protein
MLKSCSTTRSERCDDAQALRGERRCALLEAVGVDQDTAAFTELFHDLAPRIKHVLEGRGVTPATAEDIMQEAMLVVWRRAHTFDRRRASVLTWVLTVARNKHLDLLRAGPPARRHLGAERTGGMD